MHALLVNRLATHFQSIHRFSIRRGSHSLKLLAEHVGLHLRSVEGFQSDGAGVVLVVPGERVEARQVSIRRGCRRDFRRNVAVYGI